MTVSTGSHTGLLYGRAAVADRSIHANPFQRGFAKRIAVDETGDILLLMVSTLVRYALPLQFISLASLVSLLLSCRWIIFSESSGRF